MKSRSKGIVAPPGEKITDIHNNRSWLYWGYKCIYDDHETMDILWVLQE
jgi:hypothetical protein